MEPEFTAYLTRVRAHRAELRESVAALDEALASPIAASQVWRERVRAALAELSHDFQDHVELTEAPGGLYEDVRRRAPRLGGRVRRLTDEHLRFAAHLESLLDRLDGGGPVDDLGEFREEVTSLIGMLVRHRQAGSDLVFEAYQMDIGGSG